MAGLIVFNPGYLTNQGKSQIATKPFPSDMTFAVNNLVEVLIAAGKEDHRIGEAVGTSPAVFDIGTPFSTCTMQTKGLLTSPVPLPSNAAYWDVCDKKSEAVKNLIGNRLDVKEGMHISYSCTDPHMTVLIFSQEGKQVGQNIHVCAEADGVKWKFTRVNRPGNLGGCLV
jgi:hypothetical protein